MRLIQNYFSAIEALIKLDMKKNVVDIMGIKNTLKWLSNTINDSKYDAMRIQLAKEILSNQSYFLTLKITLKNKMN